jgi:hypothetical protein
VPPRLVPDRVACVPINLSGTIDKYDEIIDGKEEVIAATAKADAAKAAGAS